MSEKLVIIPAKVSPVKKFFKTFLFVLACLFFLGATFLSPTLFFVPAIIVGIIWGYLTFYSKIEYEYTYYDGDLIFAKIKNKAKRKKIAGIDMNEVFICAPKGDRALYKYENDNSIKCKKLLSGQEGAKIYGIVSKGDEKITRYEFEPDEEFIDAMRIKFPQIVIK